MTHPLTHAQELDAWGLNVLPAAHKGKAPVIKWQEWQDRRTTDHLPVWFTDTPRNYWVATGAISGVVVLDIDSASAEAWWRERIGDEMDATACSSTGKGRHYWFRIDGPVKSWGRHSDGVDFDVRGDGTGVVAPPSVHENGNRYEWLKTPDDGLVDAPALLTDPPEEAKSSAGNGSATSMLSHLLSNPPTEGGRNDWLTRVAGHYAKAYRSQEDLFDVQLELAARLCNPPLSADEVYKIARSVWDREQRKGGEGEQPSAANGELISGGSILMTPGKNENDDPILVATSDFDIEALGVWHDPEGARTQYDVILHRTGQPDLRCILPAKLLGSPVAISTWLADRGSAWSPSAGANRSATAWPSRLLAYIRNQDPQPFQMVTSLGWHDEAEGFVTLDGTITADGWKAATGVRPAPGIETLAPFTYGFDASPEEASRVLAEILTFHSSDVAAVFGAWWAACLIKPQLQKRSSQFPFMAIEAPSESGKTTGMFGMLIELAGNHKGQALYTTAAMRDSLTATRSGIVWVDDQDSVEHLTQILRAATGDGSYTKKEMGDSGGWTRLSESKLEAPVMISGEALGVSDQKALRDRTVRLSVGSPTGRKSLKDPTRPQWDDIVALRVKYPELWRMAGAVVQLALREAPPVLAEWDRFRGSTGSRTADRTGILRSGAALLDRMVGSGSQQLDEVTRWLEGQATTGSENALTLKVLPRLLRDLPDRDLPEPPTDQQPGTPVFVGSDSSRHGVGKGEVWFSPAICASWWERIQRGGRVEVRTESEVALTQQTKALDGCVAKRFTRLGGTNRTATYWKLPADVAARVLERAQGQPDNELLHPEGV